MDELLGSLLITSAQNRLNSIQAQAAKEEDTSASFIEGFDAPTGSYLVNQNGNIIRAEGLNSKAYSGKVNTRMGQSHAWVDGR